MNELIKSRTSLCFLAVLTAIAFLGNPLPSLAREREGTKGTQSGPTKGEVPPTKVRAGELEAIQARANAAAAKLDFKNPKAAKQANAELSRVHADLVAYAKANGLKLTTKEYTHQAAAKQSCEGTKSSTYISCTLTGSYTDDKGVLHCKYECVQKPVAKKQ